MSFNESCCCSAFVISARFRSSKSPMRAVGAASAATPACSLVMTAVPAPPSCAAATSCSAARSRLPAEAASALAHDAFPAFRFARCFFRFDGDTAAGAAASVSSGDESFTGGFSAAELDGAAEAASADGVAFGSRADGEASLGYPGKGAACSTGGKFLRPFEPRAAAAASLVCVASSTTSALSSVSRDRLCVRTSRRSLSTSTGWRPSCIGPRMEPRSPFNSGRLLKPAMRTTVPTVVTVVRRPRHARPRSW